MVPDSLPFKLIWASCGIMATWQISSAMHRRLQGRSVWLAAPWRRRCAGHAGAVAAVGHQPIGAPSPLGSFGPMGREVVRIGGASLGDQGSGLGAMIIVVSRLSRRPCTKIAPWGCAGFGGYCPFRAAPPLVARCARGHFCRRSLLCLPRTLLIAHGLSPSAQSSPRLRLRDEFGQL